MITGNKHYIIIPISHMAAPTISLVTSTPAEAAERYLDEYSDEFDGELNELCVVDIDKTSRFDVKAEKKWGIV